MRPAPSWRGVVPGLRPRSAVSGRDDVGMFPARGHRTARSTWVSTKDPLDESAAEALAAALTPYPWRRFTPDLLARWVVAASDRNSLSGLLGTVPGAVVGEWHRLDPADPGDPRVD